ncbi:type II restriction/modification system DNA methylase subunit YeeA [Halarchaeum solikamskense]|uniref:Eco57I restriction-modification methylase domain-containing protein n=1 Tax=Halarchaeum nitratireducens TaxID=489913 RepID=UPI001B3AE203|nr:TaqI-like C-terminal specificity domain-containing protein [Halarchaeum solikamskense]MBP2249711.1 type II restriction/modification system DNA methylase subunit YeeA [Halarchaeum solikamskense]
MHSTPTYRTNRDLFSNHYLDDHLRGTEPWTSVDDDDVRAAYESIRERWLAKRDRVADYNEAQLERNFIRPIFDDLGIPFEIEETVRRTARRPDYGFFPSADAADAAFDREDFYEEAVAVADAKRWGRKLDTRGEAKRDFENPSYQIHAYLQETPAEWAVLTNGRQWRLYYGPTSHRLDSYYEIDLPALLDAMESGDAGLAAFKEFYCFFRHEAFLPDASGDCFLDDVHDESSVFAEAIGEDLQNNIYEAIRVLAEGFLDRHDDLSEDDLDLVHDASLIYLYRLIFVLYAESEGRDLLPTDNDIYAESYALNDLKREVASKRDETRQHYQPWQTTLWDTLAELFELIDQGSEAKDIDPDTLSVPAYNGGLFRTDPDPDDSAEARFLAAHEVGDRHLAEILDLLTRREREDGDGEESASGNGADADGRVFVDYSSLDERHLGSIYEGLLEYRLDVADEALALDDGEYVPADEGDTVAVETGEVYLRTDAGERKATGSYYTPEYVVEYIVDETLGPLVDDIREDLLAQDPFEQAGGGQFAAEFAERVFELKVLDPAMGSGHFLVNAVDYLAREIIDAQERQDQQAAAAGDDARISDPTTEEGELRDINWARRKVAQQCLYGVDLNPLATELAKVSLWLRTLAAEQPLAFLDHHLKTGNSLVGSDIEAVLGDADDADEGGQLTLQQSFDHTRQRALEHVMERFTDLLSIDNETLADIKEMEAVYEDVRDDDLYQHLLAMANVHTAADFGLSVPDDAEERMAEALRDDSWADVEDQDWFTSAQAMAEDEAFFHWELEFPVAFYGDDGERLANAGFDAVIGNPPYISIENLDDQITEYLKKAYDSTEYGRFDIYLAFIEKSIELTPPEKNCSMIVPDKWLVSDYGERLREKILNEYTLDEIWDLRDVDVFGGVSNSPVVFQVRNENPNGEQTQFKTNKTHDNYYSCPQAIFTDTYECKIIIGLTESRADVLKEIEKGSERVRDFAYVSFGAQPGSLSRFVFDDLADAREGARNLGHTSSPDSLLKSFIRGRNIDRFMINQDGEYLVYDPEKLHRPAFPELFENPKIVFSEISSTLKSAYDGEGIYGNEKVVFVVRASDLTELSEDIRSQRSIPKIETVSEFGRDIDLKYVTGVLNSTLLEFYFEYAVSDGLNVYPDDIRHLPVSTSSGEQDKLSTEVETITDLKQRRASLNLSLLDYLGNYAEGPKLPDVGLYQPTGATVLDATTEAYEKLRVGEVRTVRDGRRVTVEATARYKPADEDAHETDRWGYTETDYHEAFALADLDEVEATLIEAFVPVAVAEADGFAGFRDNATKTNSLVDRLKAITLPDPDDVAADLERYAETRERAAELDEKIEETDRLIDEIVYDLYDLTEEEIEIVEEAVGE